MKVSKGSLLSAVKSVVAGEEEHDKKKSAFLTLGDGQVGLISKLHLHHDRC